MKYLIAADLHGSKYYCNKILKAYAIEKADKIIFLGDVLYHGPRNDLPRDYSPKEVVRLLNENNEKLLCVRGNCDSEVDQLVLDFPIMADYAIISMGNNIIFATHGHLYNEEKLPPLNKGDIFLSGHTHVPICKEKNGILFMNPGSSAIPKENSHNGYMIFDEKKFIWKDFEGKEVMTYCIKS